MIFVKAFRTHMLMQRRYRDAGTLHAYVRS
jgi:hypothetical protein